MWTILKSLLSSLQHCFCFIFWVFGPELCGILAPWSEVKPVPPALEGDFLTTGPPAKSKEVQFKRGLLD